MLNQLIRKKERIRNGKIVVYVYLTIILLSQSKPGFLVNLFRKNQNWNVEFKLGFVKENNTGNYLFYQLDMSHFSMIIYTTFVVSEFELLRNNRIFSKLLPFIIRERLIFRLITELTVILNDYWIITSYIQSR